MAQLRLLLQVLLFALLLSPARAGPPYLFADGKRHDFRLAMFGGSMEAVGCKVHRAVPSLANTELRNAAQIRGGIVLIERDGPKVSDADRLSFVEKARRAQRAGVVLAIMTNYDDTMIRPADSGGKGKDISIVVIAVTKSVGQLLQRAKRVDLLYDTQDVPATGSRGDNKGCTLSPVDEMVALASKTFQLGTELANNEQHSEALAAFQRALGIHPRHADAWNYLGVELGKQNRHSLAHRAFRNAVKMEPGNPNFNANKRLAQKKERDERRSGGC